MIIATPVNLDAIAAKPHPGEYVQVVCGDYGDRIFKYSEVHIVGPKCAAFHSVVFYGALASNSTFQGPSVAMVPNKKTFSASVALKVTGTAASIIKNIRIADVNISCGNAVVGLPATSDSHAPGFAEAFAAAGHNIIGWPTGAGVAVGFSQNVTLDHLNVAFCDKGVGLGGDGTVLSNSEIHHVRTSMVVGTPGDNVSLFHNWLHDTNPWNPHGDGTADHSDFAHFWTGTKSINNLVITYNLIDQGRGASTIGIHLDDSKTGLGFRNLRLDRNNISVADTQGVRIENGHGEVNNTRLFQPSVGHSPKVIICTDPKYCVPSAITQVNNVTLPGITSAATLDALRHAF